MNNFFINSGVDIFKYLEDTKFYNQTWIGAGLSRPIIDNIDLSGQFFYGSSIDTENNYTLLIIMMEVMKNFMVNNKLENNITPG